MMEVEFLGAAQTVTGSKHLVQTSRAAVLLDCGLFQGHRKEANQRNKDFLLDGKKIDAVVLSHAHIDHSGALPCIFRNGYRGPVYSTFATRDLCAPMLLDAASIMAGDANHLNKMNARGSRAIEVVEPLYTETDAMGALSLFTSIPYDHKINIAPGIDLTLLDAGHVLGSAIIILDIEDSGETRRLAFTGDLGRKQLPILRDPSIPNGVNFLILESTYGDRLHEPIELTTRTLTEVIQRTVARGGKIIVPSFALERAQEIIYSLKILYKNNLTPKIPVYVDSPLTVKLTEVFKLHPECFDSKMFDLLRTGHSPFEFPELRYISSTEESKKVSQSKRPAIVISASGMCEGGRVLHHLAATVENPRNSVLIVGFQAENTLGRKLVDKHPEIKIYGEFYNLKAEVCILNGFSAHADQKELLDFVQVVKKQGNLQKIALVHGEPAAQRILESELNSLGISSVESPQLGDIISICS